MGIPLGLRRTVGYTYDPDWDCGPTQHKSSCSKKEEEDDDSWYYEAVRRRRMENEEKEKRDNCIRIRLKYHQWYGDDQHGEFVKDWDGNEIDLRKWRRENIRKNTGHYW